MRTIRTKIYKFSELTEDAKQTAIDLFRPTENVWQKENYESLQEFAALFNLQLNRSNYGVAIRLGNIDYNPCGVKLATWLWNNYADRIYSKKQYWICNGVPNCVGVNAKHRNSAIFIITDGCPLTGYYMDNQILEPIFEYMKKPSERMDFESLMNECFEAWRVACDKDFEFQCSDEQVIDNIESNKIEFYANGQIHY